MTIPGSSNPLLLAGSAAAPPSGYNIERSVRFNSADSAYLSWTPASAGNRKTWTWAGWVKRSKLGAYQNLFGWVSTVNSSYQHYIDFSNTDKIRFTRYNLGDIGSRVTTAVYRDLSAWLHICAVWDTTQSAANDRMQLYVNGIKITAFDTTVNPSQNYDGEINNAIQHGIGSTAPYLANSGDFYLADIHFIDGQALDPTSFGEFDSNGVWQPKAYTGSYGTNGFHLPFSDNSTAAALGTDTSGNGNDWTVNNIVAGPSTTANSWSGYFDGSGDYLTTPSSSEFDFGTGSFTVECWIYRNVSGFQAIVGSRTGDTATTIRWCLFVNTTNVLACNIRDTSNNDIAYINHQTTMSLNTWNHCALVRDGTSFRLYVNGVQSTSGTTSSAAVANSSTVVRIGSFDTSAISDMNGYISNLRIVKGTAVYTSSFTAPTSPLTAITNTSLLTLQDSSFIDNSTNNFTLTANGNARVDFRSPFEDSVNTDSFVDSPTNYGTDTGVGGEVRGNYCTLNPLNNPGGSTLANGNLDYTSGASTKGTVGGTIAVSSGKWYWEIVKTGGTASPVIGFTPASRFSGTTYPQYSYYSDGSTALKSSDSFATSSSYGATYTTNDVIGVALDLDAGTCTFYKNGVSQGQAFTGITGTFVPAVSDDTGTSNVVSVTANFGQRPFAYAAPSGFKALCTANLPTPTIADGSTAMDVVTYTGNGSTQVISGLGFSPDLAWFKSRSSAAVHAVIDSVRGRAFGLITNNTDPDSTSPAANDVVSFDSNGFTLGPVSQYNSINQNGTSIVAWTWDGGSSTVTNTDGSITSQVRANPSAGFSIVTFAAQSSGSGTIGHGLGVTPEFVIVKSRDAAYSWIVWHKSLTSAAYSLILNTTAAQSNGIDAWANTLPTSSVLSLGSAYAGAGGSVAYCFAPVESYSAFGSYTGNGSTDGPFVYTGFRPRWILVKSSSDNTTNWIILDSARDSYNVSNLILRPDLANVELSDSFSNTDFLANGFKLKASGAFGINKSGTTFIYAAFAEHPFQYARAR